MSRNLTEILNVCLDEMAAGARLSVCLERYPQEAEALEPLLRTATAIRAVGPRTASAAAVERGERRMLAALDDKARQPAGARSLCGRAFRRVRDVLRPEASDRAVVRRWATAVVAGLFLLSGAAVTAASSDSVPGDTLYAVKLRSEDVRLLLASSPEARASLERQRAAERRAEVDALLRARREATVRFWGELTGLTDEAWIVGGLVVERAPQTCVDDALLLGDMVRVEARTRADGTIVGLVLEVAEHRASAPSPGALGDHTGKEPWSIGGASGGAPADERATPASGQAAPADDLGSKGLGTAEDDAAGRVEAPDDAVDDADDAVDDDDDDVDDVDDDADDGVDDDEATEDAADSEIDESDDDDLAPDAEPDDD